VKIGLVRSDLSGNGGAERYSLAVLQRLADQGWETHVFTSRLPPALPAALVPHLYMGKKTPRFFRHIAFEKWLKQAVPSCGLDYLLSLERTLPNDIYRAGGGVHRVWRDIQLREASVLRRALGPFDPSHAQMLRAEKTVFSVRNTRLVICNSAMVPDEVVKHYAYPCDRIRVVPNGVDLEKFSIGDTAAAREKADFTTEEFVVLFAGSGFWRKGADLALRILGQWKKNTHLKLRAVFVGRAENASFQELAGELGLESMVHFAGSASPADMADWYRAADLFLFPTRYDPFANACLEAAACGAAVATSSRNGFTEHLSRKTGLVLPVDADAAAQMLERFFVAPPTREQVRHAVSHLTLDAHIQQLLGVLAEADKYPRPAGLGAKGSAT